MCSKMETAIFAAEMRWLERENYINTFPAETWDQSVLSEDEEMDLILDRMENEFRVEEFPHKNRFKGSRRHANLKRDKVTRQIKKTVEPYVVNTPEQKRFKKRVMHKANRRGYMPHTEMYMIDGQRYYDCAGHNRMESILQNVL